MKKIDIDLNEENFTEWLNSVGYFLPTSEIEFERFELLHPTVLRSLSDDLVDPFAIINGTWKPKINTLRFSQVEGPDNYEEIRLAARNHSEISPEIIAKMKKNQSKNASENNNKDSI